MFSEKSNYTYFTECHGEDGLSEWVRGIEYREICEDNQQ